MRVTDLRYFLATIEAGSFGRAALSLGLQPSTLSRAIGRLEDTLGAALIERTPKGVRPTTIGRLAQKHARRVVKEAIALNEAMEQVSAAIAGEIHLGFYFSPTNNLLTKIFLEWRKTFPDISITPRETGEITLLSALSNSEIDAALLPDFLLRGHEANLPIYFEPLVAALPSYHQLANRNSLRWSDLKDENLLLWSWGKNDVGKEFFSERLPGINVRVFETGNMTLLAFVRAGYGVSVAAQAYSTLNFPGLRFIPIDEPNARIEINLVWRPETEDPVLGKFVAFMRDRARHHHRSPPFHAASESPDPPP